MLVVDSIVKRYGARTALDGVSLSLDAGEQLALLGPNGAGKSTLFSVLAGLREHDAGEIRFGGQPVRTEDPVFRRAVGVVFQSPSLDGLLTAHENLVVSAGLFGLSATQAAERAEQLLEWVDLSARADERVATYSGGMKRRLEIIRALMHRPKLLLLDEPTSGLDESGYRQVWDQLERLKAEEGVAILVVTHRSDEAERCDRVMVLDEGRLIAQGTPEALKAKLEGDVLELEGEALASHRAVIEEVAGVAPDGNGDAVALCLGDAHQVIPRLIERLPHGAVRAVRLRRPTLGDVFVELTGRRLGDAP